MGFREFYYAMESHSEEEKQKLEYNTRLQYTVARFQAAIIVSPHIKNPVKDPRDLVLFEWEEEKKQSPEEMKQLLMGLVKATSKRKHSPAAKKILKNIKDNG